jgi:hypothetical protein
MLVGVDVEVRDSGSTGLMRRLEGLAGSVTIGVHEDAGAYPDGTPVATVGAAHEFGGGVPQRSWLRGYLDDGGTGELGEVAQASIGEVVDGDAPDTVVVSVGEAGVDGIVARMNRGIAGEGGEPSRTLQDTGKLRDSIAFEVEP